MHIHSKPKSGETFIILSNDDDGFSRQCDKSIKEIWARNFVCTYLLTLNGWDPLNLQFCLNWVLWILQELVYPLTPAGYPIIEQKEVSNQPVNFENRRLDLMTLIQKYIPGWTPLRDDDDFQYWPLLELQRVPLLNLYSILCSFCSSFIYGFTKPENIAAYSDFSRREVFMFLAFVVIILLVGSRPSPFLYLLDFTNLFDMYNIIERVNHSSCQLYGSADLC